MFTLCVYGCREFCGAKHQKNLSELRSAVDSLLRTSLRKAVGKGFILQCEARLGRIALRNKELRGLSQVSYSDFYTRSW